MDLRDIRGAERQLLVDGQGLGAGSEGTRDDSSGLWALGRRNFILDM